MVAKLVYFQKIKLGSAYQLLISAKFQNLVRNCTWSEFLFGPNLYLVRIWFSSEFVFGLNCRRAPEDNSEFEPPNHSKFAVECVSKNIISGKCLFRLICGVFLPNNQIFFKLQKLENMMKIVQFQKKNVFLFLKGIFNKIGGRKICRGQPAALFIFWLEVDREMVSVLRELIPQTGKFCHIYRSTA